MDNDGLAAFLCHILPSSLLLNSAQGCVNFDFAIYAANRSAKHNMCEIHISSDNIMQLLFKLKRRPVTKDNGPRACY